MSALQVSLTKLRKYAKEHGGYELLETGEEIQLSFVPSFPEALEKSESDIQPRVFMQGKIFRDTVTFLTVEIEDSFGTRMKDMQDAELTYKSWLQFIEENY